MPKALKFKGDLGASQLFRWVVPFSALVAALACQWLWCPSLHAARPSESYSSSEIREIAKTGGDGEALPVLHGVLSPVAREYLGMVRRGEYTSAAAMEKNPTRTVADLASKLKDVNEMSSMSDWSGSAGWPFVDEEGNMGFVYQVKADYHQYSHYYMLLTVVLEGREIFVKGGLRPDSEWPEEIKNPTIENTGDFALGKLE